MSGVMIGVNGFRQSGDRAIVYYTLSDNRGKEQMLFLVKVNKKWLVQFTKNEEETPAENAEEITE
jgi:hypothetical protein